MTITEGRLVYLFRGKEMAFEFYPVQPLERVGVSIHGVRTPVEGGYRFTFTLTPSEEIVLEHVSVDIPAGLNYHSRVFVNGFQSWTESREFDLREKIAPLRWPASAFVRQSGDYTFYRRKAAAGTFHGWTYSYSRAADGNIVLYGSVSERPGYTLFEFDVGEDILRVSRDCSGLRLRDRYTALDIVVLYGREDEVFDTYFREIARADRRTDREGADISAAALAAATSSRQPVGLGDSGTAPTPFPMRRALPPASGWSSWHGHFDRISEPIIMANLAELRKRGVPLDYFVVDEGWQSGPGDWLTPSPEFPSGMKKIADAVKESGYTPGLWIAPFICGRWSGLWRHHRDWLLRDESRKPVRAGWCARWGGTFYALDIYNREFKDYLRQVFDTILGEWGFDIIKMDFLYAAGLLQRPDRTRGQVMSDAMNFLQELTGGKVSLASGVPLGPAIGKVDYCRISPGVALSWEDSLQRALGYRERVSTANAIASVLGRRHLHGRAFAAHPDAFILRTHNQRLTPAQRGTLFRLNLVLGGLALMSDNVAEYAADELALYYSAFPLREKRILGAEHRRGTWTVRFEIDGRQYLLLANLTSKPRKFRIDPAVYFDPSFPGFRNLETAQEVEPFGSKCLLRVPANDWDIAGSVGHVFPGCEVETSVTEDGGVSLSIHPHVRYDAEVFLRVPAYMESCTVNGNRVRVERACDVSYVKVSLRRPSETP